MPYKDPAKEKERQERRKQRYREDPEFRARQQERVRLWAAANPERQRELERRWAAANPDRVLAASRRYHEKNPQKSRLTHLWRKHRLRPGDVAEIWEQQNGKCYLCQEPLDLAEARVDHDHRCCPQNESCGTCRRGLVHNGCNVSIGHSGDSPERLRRWADNLESAQRAVTERLVSRHEQLVLDLGSG